MNAADAVLVTHVAVIVFVLSVPVLVWWRRHAAVHWWRTRVIHLFLTAFIAIQAVFGYECPLTTWENQLRATTGTTMDAGGFIATWLHRLIFFEAPAYVFTCVYVAFLVLVAAGFWWIPLRRRHPA